MTAFALPARLHAKADPALIATDDEHFTAISLALSDSLASVEAQLTAVLAQRGGEGQEILERDLEVHRLSGRMRALRRFGVDLCLGRIVPSDGSAPIYVGRLGLPGADGTPLLIDWRSPAAAPFFAATHAHPEGLASRRRYRWTSGRITDYWDEVFDGSASAALDDQSAFIASLGAARTSRMRDVLGTIQADQDAIVRADSRGALVVDGGPGTGKTVVALHRTAYLLYAEERLRRGGVLLIGPSDPYLAYVEDVLPGLGEDGVVTCTLRDLVPGSFVNNDPAATLKGTADMVRAIGNAVRVFEEPPTRRLLVETPWGAVSVLPEHWAEAFSAADPTTPHNLAREQVLDRLVDIIADLLEDISPTLVRRAVLQDEEFIGVLDREWTRLDPSTLVKDLWAVPALLKRAAPWLSREEVAALRREREHPFTTADLPLLDAARLAIGDPDAARKQRQRDAALADAEERMAHVIDELIASDDSEMKLMSMLRRPDAQNSLSVIEAVETSLWDGPFAHVIVDEAQELTDAEWQMVLARCPSGSLTIVGDRAQARSPFTESWESRLARVGIASSRVAPLTINYRTPTEVMEVAAPVIRAVLPDANVPVSIRSSGIPVVSVSDLSFLDGWLATHEEGVACVIGVPGFAARDRVSSLSPTDAKGLEFDLVVLADSPMPAVDRYVAMTRATERLVLLDA